VTTTEPHWLDATEMRAWRGLLECWVLLSDRLERGLSRRSDLSLADYEVLVQLSEAPEGRLRMTELAGAVLSSKSRLSHQITRMVAAGLVRRQRCPTDKRGAFAVLTEAGRAALVEAAPGHVADVRENMLEPLSRCQVEQLAEIVSTLRRHLEAERGA
jgi:DNA-binding MarR family transcriptional regulator